MWINIQNKRIHVAFLWTTCMHSWCKWGARSIAAEPKKKMDVYFVLFLFCLSTCVCVCLQFQGPLRDKVHCGSALVGPGASGLPYYCKPLVCVPAVLGGLAVWQHNNQKIRQSATARDSSVVRDEWGPHQPLSPAIKSQKVGIRHPRRKTKNLAGGYRLVYKHWRLWDSFLGPTRLIVCTPPT